MRPPLTVRAAAPLRAGVVDLAAGNPDPDCLPELTSALGRIEPGKHLYGVGASHAPLIKRFERAFSADGIPADHMIVVSGALDGLERAMRVHLRAGDAVAVEDPAFLGVLDLLQAIGLVPISVPIDEFGPTAEGLKDALEAGAQAFVLTPRAQNPTGAALDERRASALRSVLGGFPDVLVLEDDHAGPVSGVASTTLADTKRKRWGVVRSVSKSLGPDLRVAVLTGDATTIARVEGGTIIGMRWVSHVLQRLVVALIDERGMTARLRAAAQTYSERRAALVDALAGLRIEAHGRSGLNVWIPVADETETVAALLDRGWAVTAGARFRIASPPAIRVCVATLDPDDGHRLAADIASILRPTSGFSQV